MRALLVPGKQTGQGSGLFFTTPQQRFHRRPFAQAGEGAAFQTRERQQVFHHVLHARRLLRHHAQIARTLLHIQGQRLQSLHEAREHGQRGAHFVRHIRHEVTPHRISLL